MSLLLASSNRGKLEEFAEMAEGSRVSVESFPDLDVLPQFEEAAPTFAENAAGKALHYSRFSAEAILADDSGLVVPALGGAPGTKSRRYAGPHATDAQRVAKILGEMTEKSGEDRRARFVCVLAVAKAGRVVAVVSGAVEGTLLGAPRGHGGFGYDPVFFVEPPGKTFAELPRRQKNMLSHRGVAFKKLTAYLESAEV